MQKGFSNNQVKFEAKGQQQLNANSLVSNSKPGKAQGKLSFANEFVKVKAENQLARNEQLVSQDTQNFKQDSTLTQSKPVTQSSLSSALSSALEQEAQGDLKKLRDHETIKEVHKMVNSEEAIKDSTELSSKYNSSDLTMAQAAQGHQDEVTEAIREGNVDEQQAAYDHAQERKKQLANWEDLAPRIIEDPKNRAVRIDIPGLVDLETIIVRTKQGEVSIQTVGEKGLMEKLKSSESMLSKKLRDQNIQLGTLQTFDSAAVSAGAQRKQA